MATKTKKAKEVVDEKQQMIPGADEAIRAEIAKNLKLGKEYETLRMENGREEKKYKLVAQSMMEKYNIEDFVYGEGAAKVHGFFEETKKIKVRIGDETDTDEEP